MLPVDFLPPIEKYLKKLKDKQLKLKFRDAINKIRENPHIGERKMGDLAGLIGYDIYHQGINYEIAYRIVRTESGDKVIMIMAGTRENFWDAVKRYN